MANKITKKEEEFVAEYVKNGGNGTSAALKVYEPSSENSAAVIASKTLKKPSVVEALREELERQGVTIEKIISPVANGLSAVKKDSTPDYGTQLAAHDRAVKLLGLTEERSSSINFNINRANFGGEFVKNDED